MKLTTAIKQTTEEILTGVKNRFTRENILEVGKLCWMLLIFPIGLALTALSAIYFVNSSLFTSFLITLVGPIIAVIGFIWAIFWNEVFEKMECEY